MSTEEVNTEVHQCHLPAESLPLDSVYRCPCGEQYAFGFLERPESEPGLGWTLLSMEERYPEENFNLPIEYFGQ